MCACRYCARREPSVAGDTAAAALKSGGSCGEVGGRERSCSTRQPGRRNMIVTPVLAPISCPDASGEGRTSGVWGLGPEVSGAWGLSGARVPRAEGMCMRMCTCSAADEGSAVAA